MNVIAIQEAGKLDDYKHVTNSLINEETRRNEKKNPNENDYGEKAFYSKGKDRGNHRGSGGNYQNERGGSNSRYDQNNRNQSKFEGNCNYCGIYGHKEIECRKKERDNGGGNYGGNYSGNRGNYGGGNCGNYGGRNRDNYSGNRGNYGGGNRDNYSGNNRGNYGYYQCGNRNYHRNQGGNYQDDYQDNNYDQANYIEDQRQKNEQLFSAVAYTTQNDNEDYWIMDSGASNHMTSHLEWFTTYQQLQTPIRIDLGNNTRIYAQGKGNIRMELNIGGIKSFATFIDVLYSDRKNCPRLCDR
jgi:hypothetical protein